MRGPGSKGLEPEGFRVSGWGQGFGSPHGVRLLGCFQDFGQFFGRLEKVFGQRVGESS